MDIYIGGFYAMHCSQYGVFNLWFMRKIYEI